VLWLHTGFLKLIVPLFAVLECSLGWRPVKTHPSSFCHSLCVRLTPTVKRSGWLPWSWNRRITSTREHAGCWPRPEAAPPLPGWAAQCSDQPTDCQIDVTAAVSCWGHPSAGITRFRFCELLWFLFYLDLKR